MRVGRAAAVQRPRSTRGPGLRSADGTDALQPHEGVKVRLEKGGLDVGYFDAGGPVYGGSAGVDCTNSVAY